MRWVCALSLIHIFAEEFKMILQVFSVKAYLGQVKITFGYLIPAVKSQFKIGVVKQLIVLNLLEKPHKAGASLTGQVLFAV